MTVGTQTELEMVKTVTPDGRPVETDVGYGTEVVGALTTVELE